MAEGIALPELTASEANAVEEVLLVQERELRYERFGSAEALKLGNVVASLVPDFGEGASVTITREADGVCIFQ